MRAMMRRSAQIISITLTGMKPASAAIASMVRIRLISQGARIGLSAAAMTAPIAANGFCRKSSRLTVPLVGTA